MRDGCRVDAPRLFLMSRSLFLPHAHCPHQHPPRPDTKHHDLIFPYTTHLGPSSCRPYISRTPPITTTTSHSHLRRTNNYLTFSCHSLAPFPIRPLHYISSHQTYMITPLPSTPYKSFFVALVYVCTTTLVQPALALPSSAHTYPCLF